MVEMAVREQDFFDCHALLLRRSFEHIEVAARVGKSALHGRCTPNQAAILLKRGNRQDDGVERWHRHSYPVARHTRLCKRATFRIDEPTKDSPIFQGEALRPHAQPHDMTTGVQFCIDAVYSAFMTGAMPSTPFVLLDDARVAGAAPARLYRDPIEVVSGEIDVVLARLISAQAEGLHAAGFFTYDAGYGLEPSLNKSARSSSLPEAWFGLFRRYDDIRPENVEALLPPAEGGWTSAPKPTVTKATYAETFSTVKSYITAGDIYQVNLTFPCVVDAVGHPLALYAGLRRRAKAGYGGVIWTGTDWLLSLSPELFFALQDGKVTTKPMKGTAVRCADATCDEAAIHNLQSDPKQRAENLMIVDLLRNDLSRVAERGTVTVPELFSVETYPTVHQMTSTITAQLQQGLGAVDVIKAIYPCGSITGAPKIRAMEIITEVEPTARGAYTGSIGRIDPSGDAAFNVAIRTLHMSAGSSCARMGLGGGIVADSQMQEEWRECIAKGKFVADDRPFDLIETMRFDPATGIALLERHLARLNESASTFGFAFDRHAARNSLQAATFRLSGPRRVRLMLARTGSVAIEVTPLPPAPLEPVVVSLAPLPVDPSDFRLRHKTSDRQFYRDVKAKGGTFEVALVDPEGFVTEGCFTNIFVKRDGVLLTPPASRGLLPGVFRAELIAQSLAIETDLRAEDLSGDFYVGNASRGLIAARIG
jgi:para-aminobenzoate synthetase / 4-amino-4-deoxychorismate lyase